MPLGNLEYEATRRQMGVEAANKKFLLERVNAYPYLVATNLGTPKPPQVDHEMFGHFMCAPLRSKNVTVWGFKTQAKADAFADKYGTVWGDSACGAVRIAISALREA